MNLLLLEDDEIDADGLARLGGRRALHVMEVLRAAPGDRIQVGLVGGLAGEGLVLAATAAEVALSISLHRAPPPPSPVSLLLALPRPKILRKVLQASAAMGVKRIALVGSYRVEKSYFGSPFVAPDAIRRELLLGLEQGKDTALPVVTVHRHFKPFVEDVLEGAFPSATRLLAHPDASGASLPPGPRSREAAIAIGPEGGWTPYELAALEARRFLPYSLGVRPLRVDQAVPFAVGQVELWLRPGVRAPT